MSVKKLLILAAAGVVSTSALAGGASNYSAPATAMSSEDQVGLYVGVNAGWNQLGWKSENGTAAGASWNNAGKNGSFTGGLDVGYSFNQYLALELGGFWFPSNVKYTNSSSNTSSLKIWDLYLAGKATVPLYEDLNVFGKFGLAYTHTNVGSTGAPANVHTGTENNWEPMFAVGLGYDFAQDWNVNAQYLHVVSHESNGTIYSPSQNVYTLGVAYTFAM